MTIDQTRAVQVHLNRLLVNSIRRTFGRHPGKRQILPKLRAFIDHLKAER